MPNLGIILPDDGPIGYEWLQADGWLRRRGLGHLRVRVERTQPIGGHVRDELFRAGNPETFLPPARRLAAGGSDVLVWACTSGSFIGGLAWARRQLDWLEEATGLPATSATIAMITAARALGTDAVDVLSPYPRSITAAFLSSLGEAGITVDVAASLGAPDGPASFGLDIRSEAARFAARFPARGRPLLVPDTAVDTLDLVHELEAITARPVATANQACLWHGMTLAGRGSATIPAAGSLFDRPSGRMR